ncbi:hypothetical protein BHE74_00050358 [Ensete ventricosum]|nr:hypothetical protein BHE74_00050358 [Ensete ventricosum]RZS27145.1 hypothetical protein BHM03_00060571 [Ensete ventricosum]
MHPLRFPNNSVRAKAARRRGGQPPCKTGHPRPGHDQDPLQGGDRLRSGQARKGGQRRPQGVVAAHRGSSPSGGPAVGCPQGATAHGQPCRQQGRRHRS